MFEVDNVWNQVIIQSKIQIKYIKLYLTQRHRKKTNPFFYMPNYPSQFWVFSFAVLEMYGIKAVNFVKSLFISCFIAADV